MHLGCCPEAVRCALCPSPPSTPDAELVDALIASYRDRAEPGDALQVSFFGGPPPPAALLEATGGLPVLARVRPDLLTRAEAKRLADAGVRAVELDALTFHDAALDDVGRRYGGARVRQMADGLKALGLRIGVVLAPGLPGTSHATAVRDAEIAAEHFHFARLHPVLVLAGSGLRERLQDGRYAPLELGAAVTTCRQVLEVLEAGGVEVIRVGLQPGNDGYGRAVAGPRHSSLRELVEARRVLDRLRALLDEQPLGAQIVIRCAPSDETRTRGPRNQHVRTLRAEFHLDTVRITADPALPRGAWSVENLEETS